MTKKIFFMGILLISAIAIFLPIKLMAFPEADRLLTPKVDNKSEAQGEVIQAAVGYPNVGGRANFNIPRQYNPTIGYHFFKIIVSYPGMEPLRDDLKDKLRQNALEIIVDGYPVNGTTPERIINSLSPAKYISRNEDYSIYKIPMGNSPPTEVRVTRDELGDAFMLEIYGDWSRRNLIVHGVRPAYEIRCYFNKTNNYNFISIDKSVAKFIASMKKG